MCLKHKSRGGNSLQYPCSGIPFCNEKMSLWLLVRGEGEERQEGETDWKWSSCVTHALSPPNGHHYAVLQTDTSKSFKWWVAHQEEILHVLLRDSDKGKWGLHILGGCLRIFSWWQNYLGPKCLLDPKGATWARTNQRIAQVNQFKCL